MSVRTRPESYFATRSQVSTQEPLIVQTEPQPIIVNTTALVILAIVSIIALVGFFAYLSSGDKKCQCRG
ncbi:hypothetical protein MUP77_21765 [Candidatus Bathyarchaeota archaeon]|nr:hypothetical protein [Candidatus Bathyarchaeota archaeon]